MTFSLGMLSSQARPVWGATLALLALLASETLGQDKSPAANRSTASRYAAKQVRVPEDKPVAVAKPVAKKTVQQDRQVRPVQHMEPPVMHRSSMSGRMPRTAMRTNARMMQGEVMMDEGEVVMQGDMPAEQIPTPEGEMRFEHGDVVNHAEGGCADGCCGDDSSCGNCGQCGNCCLIPCPRLSLDKLEFFAGAHGFTGPLNRGESGSFGFHEGVNWGSNLPCAQRDWISMQLGFQATQSNFAGSEITDKDRRQFFVTGGFFRRVDWGLQGGAVIDYMHDEWYYEGVDLTQVRAELSWVFPGCHELGAWVTHGSDPVTSQATIWTNNTSFVTVTDEWQPTNLYAFFYRRRFDDCGATGRIFGGFTGASDGLVGADLQVPLTERLALRSDFTYLIPGENQSTSGYMEESWNVGLTLVWYPGCRTSRSHDYNRPLFNVADNGTFMVDRN